MARRPRGRGRADPRREGGRPHRRHREPGDRVDGRLAPAREGRRPLRPRPAATAGRSTCSAATRVHERSSKMGRWETKLLADAREMWFVNEPIRAWYAKEYPDVADRMHVVMNGWDPELAPTSADPVPAQRPLTYGYLGTISKMVPLAELVAAGSRRATTTRSCVRRAARCAATSASTRRRSPRPRPGAGRRGVGDLVRRPSIQDRGRRGLPPASTSCCSSSVPASTSRAARCSSTSPPGCRSCPSRARRTPRPTSCAATRCGSRRRRSRPRRHRVGAGEGRPRGARGRRRDPARRTGVRRLVEPRPPALPRVEALRPASVGVPA